MTSKTEPERQVNTNWETSGKQVKINWKTRGRQRSINWETRGNQMRQLGTSEKG